MSPNDAGRSLMEVTFRAANSDRGFRGSPRTPSHPVEDAWDPLQMGRVP
jgi:hypothetical protein